MRLMVYETLVCGTPPSSVDGIVRAVLKHVAPFIKVKMPVENTIKYMRVEIGLVSDAMSALVLANLVRILQIGHDATEVNGTVMLAANIRGELGGGKKIDVMLRGCFVAKGRTSVLELKSILEAMEHMKSVLKNWRDEHDRLFPDGPAHDLPDPDGIDLTKLLGGSIMSDNAAAATRTSELIVAHLLSAVKEMVEEGDEALEGPTSHVRELLDGLDAEALAAMSDDELNDLVGPLIVTCARHTSNLLVDYGAEAEFAYLKTALAESLDTFTSFERVTTNVTALLRAAGKETDFRSQATYPKGDAVSYFFYWLKTNHKDTLVLNSFRAMLGGRQDHKLAAALELWWNRKVFSEFIMARSAQEPTRSKLRDALEVELLCEEVVGALIACSSTRSSSRCVGSPRATIWMKRAGRCWTWPSCTTR